MKAESREEKEPKPKTNQSLYTVSKSPANPTPPEVPLLSI